MSDISRRDFLNGVALTVVAGATPTALLAQEKAPPYPPALAGWRGSIPDSYGVAHALRDGKRYDIRRMPVEERYDLVVVGAGIVGASVAYHAARAGAVVTLVDAGRPGAGDEAAYACLHVVGLDGHTAGSTGADSSWLNRLRRTPGRTGSARLTIQPRSITGSKPSTRR